MSSQKISCIVPVYNNAKTLEIILKAVLGSQLINEVVVVDDGSNDKSYSIAKKYKNKIKLLKNNRNLGKGSAFAKGFRSSNGELILTCDADHEKLTTQHIDNIIKKYLEGSADMVVAARESNFGWGYLMGLISGERLFTRKSIEKYLSLIEKSRFGMEQVINKAHNGKRVQTIVSKNIGHVLKYKRKNIPSWLKEYFLQVLQMINTSNELRKFKN